MTATNALSPLSTTTTYPPPSSPSAPFTFPREYHFPPFFSRQDNLTTASSQRQKWGTLIQAYCRAHKIFKLSLVDAIDTDLFYNRKINKRLSIVDARAMVEFLRSVGRAEWITAGPKDVDAGRNVAWIWWRNVEEWAQAIAEWVEETGQKNTVLTLYELTESDATLSQGGDRFFLEFGREEWLIED